MTTPKRTNPHVARARLDASIPPPPRPPKESPIAQAPQPASTADSSGFVDLAAFSEHDDAWVDRALASARGAPSKPTVPPSIAPVAMEALAPPPSRSANNSALGAIVFVAACVAVSAGGIASAVLVLRGRGEKAMTATAQLAAMTFTPPAVASSPPPPVADAPAQADPPAVASASIPSHAHAKKAAAGGFHAASPSPARATPARRAPSGGGSSFDEMIRRAALGKPH